MGNLKKFILLALFSLFFANIFGNKLAENADIESFKRGGWHGNNDTCGGYFISSHLKALSFTLTEEMISPMYNGSQICIWTVFSQPTTTYYKVEIKNWTLPSLPAGCSNEALSINSFKDRDSKSLVTNGPYCGTQSEFIVEGCLMAIVLRFGMSSNLIGKGFTLTFSAPSEAFPDPQDRRLFEMFYTWGGTSSLPGPLYESLGNREISVLSLPKGNVTESIWTFSFEIIHLEFPNTTLSEFDNFGNQDADDFSYLSIWEITSDGRFANNPLDIYTSIKSSSMDINKVYNSTYGIYVLWNGRNYDNYTIPDTKLSFNYFTIRT